MSLDLSADATQILLELASNTHVKLVRSTPDSYDPVTGVETAGVTTTFNLVAADLPMTEKLLENSRVKATDKLIMTDNQVKPFQSDKILVDDIEYTIVMIDSLNHAGIVQYYEIVARG